MKAVRAEVNRGEYTIAAECGSLHSGLPPDS
jgi:hypothetical protein